MTALFELLGGIKGIAAIALIVALGGYVWNQNSKISQAATDLKTVTAERDLAAEQRDKAVGVNVENQTAIKQLTQEKIDIQTSLNNLEAARKKDAVVIGQLSTAIKAQASNPANKVTLSPVLRDVVSGIQAERNRRQGVTQ